MFKLQLDSETFLVLAPRWADLGTAWQIVLLAALLVVPLVLILGLYRYELRLIARLPAFGLLLLRLSILLVIWFTVGVQPTQLLDALVDPKTSRDIHATDLAQSLTRDAVPNQPLRGILLFSDGQHNVGAPPYDRADELGKQRVPIFPVVIGSREPPHDL